MASNKKETAKQVGIIGCIGAGLFGLYQLLIGGDSDALNTLKAIVKPLHDKAHEHQKQTIKEAVKEALKEAFKEYELEKNKGSTSNK